MINLGISGIYATTAFPTLPVTSSIVHIHRMQADSSHFGSSVRKQDAIRAHRQVHRASRGAIHILRVKVTQHCGCHISITRQKQRNEQLVFRTETLRGVVDDQTTGRSHSNRRTCQGHLEYWACRHTVSNPPWICNRNVKIFKTLTKDNPQFLQSNL